MEREGAETNVPHARLLDCTALIAIGTECAKMWGEQPQVARKQRVQNVKRLKSGYDVCWYHSGSSLVALAEHFDADLRWEGGRGEAGGGSDNEGTEQTKLSACPEPTPPFKLPGTVSEPAEGQKMCIIKHWCRNCSTPAKWR